MKNTRSERNRSALLTLLAIAATIACLSTTQSASAHELSATEVCQHANELNCAAKEMREEIKLHFRQSDRYRKLLVTNTQLKLRSAALARRIQRNPDYRGFDRDVCKLDELSHELAALFQDAVNRSAQGVDDPVAGDPQHVAAQINSMVELVDCIRWGHAESPVFFAAPEGEFLLQKPAIIIPEFDPNFQTAPGVLPEMIETPVPGPVLAPPKPNSTTPSQRSVLDGSIN